MEERVRKERKEQKVKDVNEQRELYNGPLEIDYNPNLGTWCSNNPQIPPGAAAEIAEYLSARYEWSGEYAGHITVPAANGQRSAAMNERALRAEVRAPL